MDYWSNLMALLTRPQEKSDRAVDRNRMKFQMAMDDLSDFLVAFSIAVALIALAYVVILILAS